VKPRTHARPFQGLLTRDVYKKAEDAARRGEADTFDDCVRELRSRKRGPELVAELDEIRPDVGRRAGPSAGGRALVGSDLDVLTLLTDAECHRRIDVMRDARRSIWLSTYCISDGTEELRDLLIAKARAGVRITLIVSPKPTRPGTDAHDVVIDLRRAGVRVTIATNHSKCVVVDEEHVIIGSANLQSTIWRDVAIQFRSNELAAFLIAYLEEVADAGG
jgi:hypothetical protein